MKLKLQPLDEFRVRIAQEGKMRVPGLIYASPQMMRDVQKDDSPSQVANVAHLPGILKAAMAMPDVHYGYGFPIGGVAAFDSEAGVLSPGGVGYDINCGVRLLRTNIPKSEAQKTMRELAQAVFDAVPSGLGAKAARRLTDKDLERVLTKGAAWAISEGYGRKLDLEVLEENGTMLGAEPDRISKRAKERGQPQLGSLGSGNHFCEVGSVSEVFDPEAAQVFGLAPDTLTVMIHTGSRGFGYQVCDDALREMIIASRKYGIELPDRQLCAAPLSSPEAHGYLASMACAINYAFANRQLVTHFVREAFAKHFGQSWQNLQMDVVYDVCHNIAKFEEHVVDGALKRVCVHRKGATRAFGPGHQDVPEVYRAVGQPVLVPGDMGRYSYVLKGTEKAMLETFGSCCHGAGRQLSRAAAKKAAQGRPIFKELEQQGVLVKSDSKGTVAEELPEAYKDVSDVVDVMHGAGIALKVAKLVPLAVIKG